MPKTRNYKNKNKKKQGYKRRGARMVARPLSLGPKMPNSIIAKHKFVHSFSLTEANTSPNSFGGVGSTNMNSFRLNSLFDPDVKIGSGTGGTAAFHENMALHYNTYRVLGAKVYMKFINLGAEPIYIATCKGGAQQVSESAALTLAEWKELKYSKTAVLHGMNTGPKSVRLLTETYSPEAIEGKRKALIRADPNFESLSQQSPAEPHFYTVAATQINSTSSVQDMAVQCEITILFTALWNDRKIDYPQSGQ